MTTTEALHQYAEAQIKSLGLGDSPTNCHGVAAYVEPNGVRLSDGTGLNVICRDEQQIDAELDAMAEWYAESK